jgi:predicted Zn-dependent peptidase
MEAKPSRIRRRYDTAQFELTHLENGIPIWIQKSPIHVSEEGILIGFLPGIGSCRDPKGQEGVAHFFEHMPFKGTENFPHCSSITTAVDGLGGSWNAATSTEWTRFHIKLTRPHFETAAHVISELIAKPLLRNEDVLTERGVIADEHLRRAPFLGARQLEQDLARLTVGDYPYNHPVIGRRQAIKSMTRAMLTDFWEKYYHSGNLQLIVGGAFAQRPDILDILNREFRGIRSGAPVLAIATPVCDHGRFRLTDPRYVRSALVIGWMVSPPEGRKSYAMNLLLDSLGRGMDAPLVEYLRSKVGKTYGTNFVQYNEFAPFWSVGFAFPIPIKYFGGTRDMVVRLLEDPWSHVGSKHERNIARRASAWCDPIDACMDAVGEITTNGRPTSFREVEDEQDSTERADIEYWRHLFLKSAVDCEIRSVPPPFSRLLSFTGLM